MPSLYTLNDLLGRVVFARKYPFLHNDLDYLIVAWAENQKSLYWHLFDEWEGPGTSEAVRMKESEFFELINRTMLPYSRKIENPDWLELLVR